tara:strand:- start:3321 stop:3551 length:231 start_codon:yes stop_codon:yes gene_type:complete
VYSALETSDSALEISSELDKLFLSCSSFLTESSKEPITKEILSEGFMMIYSNNNDKYFQVNLLVRPTGLEPVTKGL